MLVFISLLKKFLISSFIINCSELINVSCSDLVLIIFLRNSSSGDWISITNPPENLDLILSCILTNLLGGRSPDITI